MTTHADYAGDVNALAAELAGVTSALSLVQDMAHMPAHAADVISLMVINTDRINEQLSILAVKI